MQVGGFKLPFIVVGSAIFLVGFASMFVLPAQNGTFHLCFIDVEVML